MGATLRALRALVLLTGFYLFGLILLGALAALDWAATLWAPASVYGKLYIITALLAIPVVRGMFLLRTPKNEDVAGLPVTEAREPRLWATVRTLAEQVGTRAPDEIVLVGETNAAVSEDSRFLGLVGGRRRLFLGLPLMAGLTEAQLRAVLAHELGHYSNADTRLAAITVRGRFQVLRTVAHFEERAGRTAAKERARQEKKAAKALAKGKKAKEVDTWGAGVTYRTMARLYTAYAKLYVRATESGSRRQELAADLAAARIAGRDATASALREIPVLDATHEFYMRSYATLGVGAGLLPPRGEVFGGIRHLLAARHEELDTMRRELPTETSSPYDSHPPIAERVARIEALPDDGRASEPTRPSLGLLSSPEEALAALEQVVLTPEALTMQRAEWPQLVHESMAVYADRLAEPLREAMAAVAVPSAVAARPSLSASPSASPSLSPSSSPSSSSPSSSSPSSSLSALLDVIDGGALWEVADRLPKSEQARAATGRVAREFARPALRRGLSHLVTSDLIRRGRAHWQLSWTESARLRLPAGYEESLPAALDAAVADAPDTAPLRKLLAS
ncbi:M48 family metallopeptidase [Streptomyces sp. NPDC050804]|uniref:M48 family metallopeptidase n=1 Tax=Streptomyces sp. NPDC050804 TaxID=3154745 RepID=UPI00342F61E4